MCTLVVETTSICIMQAPTRTPQAAGLALSIGHGWGIFRCTSPDSPRTFRVDRETQFPGETAYRDPRESGEGQGGC